VRISWLAAIQFRSLLPPRTLLLFHHDPLPHSSSLDRSDSTIARDKDLSPIHATASEITIYLNCYFVTWCRQTKNAKHVLHERPSYSDGQSPWHLHEIPSYAPGRWSASVRRRQAFGGLSADGEIRRSSDTSIQD
jgi:hypothetical protein